MKTQNINLPSTTGWGEHKFSNRANHYICTAGTQLLTLTDLLIKTAIFSF